MPQEQPLLANLSKIEGYVLMGELKSAIEAVIRLQRPLLIKGEPGTGKSVLAKAVAKALNVPLITWHIKSTTRAQQGLYEYDAVARLRDSQLGREEVKNIANYIKKGCIWEAFTQECRPVLLIDEIDKADVEFPNDLLEEIDTMSFYIYETKQTITARHRPIIIITSNNEKELPAAFLRRCFFHYIAFPDQNIMRKIVHVHFPDIKERLLSEALTTFYRLRDVPGIKKPPSTSEMLDWLTLLINDDLSPEDLRENNLKTLLPPLHGALFKNENDIHLLQKLAFLNKREQQR